MARLATGLAIFAFCASLVTCGGEEEEATTEFLDEIATDTPARVDNSTADLQEDVKEMMEAIGLMSSPARARMKMSDVMFHPAMLLPQLIMWGFAPILLANLKMLVMQALMVNKMALSSAIFMTLRNIVFGPRPGPLVKYANYGYSHGQNNFHHHHRYRRRS